MHAALPIGIKSFREIRENNHYYVDKTAITHQLIDEGNFYLLSRPKLFGKSLLLDTLAELFEGNEPLFRGLAVHQLWDWIRRFPVIRISFAGKTLHSRQALDASIDHLLHVNTEKLGLPSGNARDIPGRFAELIRNAERSHGQRVVVLIDEYDKPVRDNLESPQLCRDMANGLLNLYSVIKDSGAHIRFAMLAGVSKFSTGNLFSGLNNLHDITLDARYSAICGFTEDEVDAVFAPALDGLDRDEIRSWYSGYNWRGATVYNPFDLLMALRERRLGKYWFEASASPFILERLLTQQVFAPRLSDLCVMESQISHFDIEHIPVEALLFQAGYLTITHVRRLPGQLYMTLSYPNLAIRSGLNGALLERMKGSPALAVQQTSQLQQLLRANDLNGLRELLEDFCASIPHDGQHDPATHYIRIFYRHFAALELDVRLEDGSSQARIDLAVLLQHKTYLISFKVMEQVPEVNALQWIKDCRYPEKYRRDGSAIYLIGVEFSRETQSMVRFDVEMDTH